MSSLVSRDLSGKCKAARGARLVNAKESLPKIFGDSSKSSARCEPPTTFDTHTMPRQRSKKLTASRIVEAKSAAEEDPASDGINSENETDDSDNESLISVEKDEEEEELDRLVFGDGAGFKAMLGQDMEVDSEDKDGDNGVEEDGSEAGLEHVDDADVRSPCIEAHLMLMGCAAFLSGLWAIWRFKCYSTP